jgi:hypothetical protein
MIASSLQSALNFFMNRILILEGYSQTFELLHLFKGITINLYIVTSSPFWSRDMTIFWSRDMTIFCSRDMTIFWSRDITIFWSRDMTIFWSRDITIFWSRDMTIFWSRAMTIFLALSAFFSSPLYLLATTKAPVFFFVVFALPPNVLRLAKTRSWFWHSEECASWYVLIIKTNEIHYFSALFGKELYMFRTDLLSIIRGLNTVFTAIGTCHTSYVTCLLVPSWPRQLFVYIRWHDGDNGFIGKWLYIRNLNSLCWEIFCSFGLLLFVVCLVICNVLGEPVGPVFQGIYQTALCHEASDQIPGHSISSVYFDWY